MAIIKLKKYIKPKPLLGIILNNLESNLYHAMGNKKLANEILKESLNIHPRRFITIVEVTSGEDELLDLLVVFDKLLSEEEEIEAIATTEITEFNFHIYNFNKKEKRDVENMINLKLGR